MAIEIVVLAVVIGILIYLPFFVIRMFKSEQNEKALKHPEGKRWFALMTCAGEVAFLFSALAYVLQFPLLQYQWNQLPDAVQWLGVIIMSVMALVGWVGLVWAGKKFTSLR
jgi:protein-S-isoprenylcysteine O-methyltransferase Ste14